MLDAVTGRCFVRGAERVSLRQILSEEGEGHRFAGPTPFLEVVQLLLAVNIVADLLEGEGVEPDLGVVDVPSRVAHLAELAISKIDADPERFALEGDGPRYLQVRLPPERVEKLDVTKLEGTLWPNFSSAATDPKAFNLGRKPLAGNAGFCPSCALIGLFFAENFSAGTGGKVAGMRRASVFAIPTTVSLRETIIRNAVAWFPGRSPIPPEWQGLRSGDRDPWSDPVYLNAVRNSGPFLSDFRTVRNLRNLTPWALELIWEHTGGVCSLCGLSSDVLAVGGYGPKKDGSSYPSGKLGWPKVVSKGDALVNEALPAPYSANVERLPQRATLLSVAASLLGQGRPRVLQLGSWVPGPCETAETSVVVATIFNDHKGAGSYDFVVHIPLRSDPDDIAAVCAGLYEEFEHRRKQLYGGLKMALGDVHSSQINRHIDVWRGVSERFIEFIDDDNRNETWRNLLIREALRVFDHATESVCESPRESDRESDRKSGPKPGTAASLSEGRYIVSKEMKEGK